MEELDLKELFSIFWNKRLEILLITLIFLVIGIVYSYFGVKPEYKASTNMVLVQSSATSKNGESAITTTDITMNSKLISTYSALIKRNAVLGKVASNLNLSEEEIEKVKDKITVKSVQDTEIIEITVKDKDPNFAAKVANEIATVFSEKIVEIYNMSNVYILDKAEPETQPCNINHGKDIAIFAFIGIIISAIVVLLLNMLDTTIKTEEDIEKATKLMVLTLIPTYDGGKKAKKGGRR